MESTTQVPSVEDTFGEHHRRLERMCDELIETLRVGDARQACRQWSALDQELSEHMALEEQLLFPRLAELEPAEVESLRSEHQELRRDVAELGVAVDLHRASEPVAKAFFDRLRAHAAREDVLLYRWADRQLRDRGSLIERLRRITHPVERATLSDRS